MQLQNSFKYGSISRIDVISLLVVVVLYVLTEVCHPLIIGNRFPLSTDTEYSMPFAKSETVSMGLLSVYVGPIAVLLHFLIDYLSLPLPWATKQEKRNSAKVLVSKLFWGYAAALLYGLFFVEVIKQTAGSPRPDFLYRCQPEWKSLPEIAGNTRRLSSSPLSPLPSLSPSPSRSLSSPPVEIFFSEKDYQNHINSLFPPLSSSPEDANAPLRQLRPLDFPSGVTYAVCTGDAKVITEGRKSFPSGHAFCAMYTSSFLALMLFFQFRKRASTLLLSGCQAILFCLAAFIGASRYIDFRHRPVDIIVGFLLGAVFAVWGSHLAYYRGNIDFPKLASSEETGERLVVGLDS